MNLNNSIKKVKITLEYQSHSINVEIEPYRPISYIREIAKKKFYPLNYEIKLIYSNKDLTPFDTISIGELFKNKSQIFIKIVQILIIPNKIDKLKENETLHSYGNHKQNFSINTKEDLGILNSENEYNNLNNLPNFVNSYPHYNKINQNINNTYILCPCRSDIVNYYCRNDNTFLCKNCRFTVIK